MVNSGCLRSSSSTLSIGWRLSSARPARAGSMPFATASALKAVSQSAKERSAARAGDDRPSSRAINKIGKLRMAFLVPRRGPAWQPATSIMFGQSPEERSVGPRGRGGEGPKVPGGGKADVWNEPEGGYPAHI